MPNDTTTTNDPLQTAGTQGLPPLPGDIDNTPPAVTPISTDTTPPSPFGSAPVSPAVTPTIPETPVVKNSSILNPPPTPSGGAGNQTPPSDGPSGGMVTSQHVPKKYGGGKVIATIFGVLLLVGAIAAGVTLVQRAQLFQQKANEGTGTIAIFKFICDKVGEQDVCNGRDTSLGDYKVDFKVHTGENDQTPVVQNITVTISDNQNGQGNTGNASQGRSVGDSLNTGKYTVCEIPIAYNSTGDRVPLKVEPRPEAGNGGSSGGTNQKQFGENCITVDLNPGEAELKYLDKREAPAATPTPVSTSTVTPTKKPGATNTPTPVATSTLTPTLPPGITAQCNSVKTYNSAGTLLTTSDLSKLKAGDKVKFAVSGQTSSGTFSKARFSVNGTLVGETTTTNSSGEFYLEYTIPQNVTTFSVKGEVYHSTLGWI